MLKIVKKIIAWLTPYGMVSLYNKLKNSKQQTANSKQQTANSKQQTIDFNEYSQLNKLKNINGSRLVELAILRHIKDTDFVYNNTITHYSEKEHRDLWNIVNENINQNQNPNEFYTYLKQFLTQFSPDNNQYQIHNVSHISRYVHTALEFQSLIQTEKKLNIIELGANHALLSKTLEMLGHNVLCSDLHHGIIGESIMPYKAGTWLRENFIGLKAVDTFIFNVDPISNLCIFPSGVDAILMRGTGILNLCHDKDQNDQIITNILRLLPVLNDNGIIFAKNENIYFDQNYEIRIKKLEKLKRKLENSCSIDFKVETATYSNPGWETFNITLVCRKNAKQIENLPNNQTFGHS